WDRLIPSLFSRIRRNTLTFFFFTTSPAFDRLFHPPLETVQRFFNHVRRMGGGKTEPVERFHVDSLIQQGIVDPSAEGEFGAQNILNLVYGTFAEHQVENAPHSHRLSRNPVSFQDLFHSRAKSLRRLLHFGIHAGPSEGFNGGHAGSEHGGMAVVGPAVKQGVRSPALLSLGTDGKNVRGTGGRGADV